MKQGKVRFKKSYLIFVGIALIFVLYGYSKLTAVRIENVINKTISNYQILGYTTEDAKDYLISKGYMIINEMNGNDYSMNSKSFLAQREDEIIEVYNEDIYWIKYTFKNTVTEQTPFIYNVEFGDSYELVRNKIGLNFFNLLFQNIKIFNPGVYSIDNDYILYSNGEYNYMFRFDQAGCLNQIEYQNLNYRSK